MTLDHLSPPPISIFSLLFCFQTRNLGIILDASHFLTFHIQTIDYIYPLHALSFAHTLSSVVSRHAFITMGDSTLPQLSTLDFSRAFSTRKPEIFLKCQPDHTPTAVSTVWLEDNTQISCQRCQGHKRPSPTLQPSLSLPSLKSSSSHRQLLPLFSYVPDSQGPGFCIFLYQTHLSSAFTGLTTPHSCLHLTLRKCPASVYNIPGTQEAWTLVGPLPSSMLRSHGGGTKGRGTGHSEGAVM